MGTTRDIISHTPHLIVRRNIKMYKILLRALPPYPVLSINIFCMSRFPPYGNDRLSALPYFPLTSHLCLNNEWYYVTSIALFDFQSQDIADFLCLANGPRLDNGFFETLYREAELYCVLFKQVIDYRNSATLNWVHF